jgi:hypothetical protein
MCTLKKCGRRMWASFIWFWIGTRGGLLWTRNWNFVFYKTRRMKRLLLSQSPLTSMQYRLWPRGCRVRQHKHSVRWQQPTALTWPARILLVLGARAVAVGSSCRTRNRNSECQQPWAWSSSFVLPRSRDGMSWGFSWCSPVSSDKFHDSTRN